MPTKPHDEGKTASPKRSSSPKKKPRKKSAKAEGRDEKGQFTPENPTAWKPGQSGNVKGRPKCRTLSESFRAKLSEVDPDDPLGRTFAEIIAEHQVRVAAGRTRESSTLAAKELADRVEGRVKQALDLDVKGDARRLLSMLLGVNEEDLDGVSE